MAKYDVKFSCGHTGEVELVGKHEDRRRKIKYFEENGLCRECYKKKMDEEASKQKFSFNASVLPYINEQNGEILLNVWFEGNTKPHKDEIKSLGGYRWAEREDADDYFSLKRSPLCWIKMIELKDLNDEIKKVKSIGVEHFSIDKGLFATINFQIVAEKHKKWKEKREKIASLEKPVIPAILAGRSWNEKIYGIKIQSIYLDGEKVEIDSEQVEELEKYLAEKEEYREKVREIKNL